LSKAGPFPGCPQDIQGRGARGDPREEEGGKGMKDQGCINEDCRYYDNGSETGCCASLSHWEDCQMAEFDEDDDEDDDRELNNHTNRR